MVINIEFFFLHFISGSRNDDTCSRKRIVWKYLKMLTSSSRCKKSKPYWWIKPLANYLKWLGRVLVFGSARNNRLLENHQGLPCSSYIRACWGVFIKSYHIAGHPVMMFYTPMHKAQKKRSSPNELFVFTNLVTHIDWEWISAYVQDEMYRVVWGGPNKLHPMVKNHSFGDQQCEGMGGLVYNKRK